MKTIKLSAVLAAIMSAGAVLVAVPGVSSAANEEGLDIHGWRIDPQDAANHAAASSGAFTGTSLRVEPDGLGFTDPRPGQSDYGSMDGELGFTDPRPGE